MNKLFVVVLMAFSASACATAHMEKTIKVSEHNCAHVQKLYDNVGPQALTPADGDLLDRCHDWGYQSSQTADAPKPLKLKPIHVRKDGIDFKRGADGIAYINGAAASHDESTDHADVYNGGLLTIIVYKNGKINAMEDGHLVGRLK